MYKNVHRAIRVLLVVNSELESLQRWVKAVVMLTKWWKTWKQKTTTGPQQTSFNFTQLHEVNPKQIVISRQDCSLCYIESKPDAVICLSSSPSLQSALRCCARHNGGRYKRSYRTGGWIHFVCAFASHLVITSHIWTIYIFLLCTDNSFHSLSTDDSFKSQWQW